MRLRFVAGLTKRNFLVANLAEHRHGISNQEVAIMSDRIEKSIELNAPVERVWLR